MTPQDQSGGISPQEAEERRIQEEEERKNKKARRRAVGVGLLILGGIFLGVGLLTGQTYLAASGIAVLIAGLGVVIWAGAPDKPRLKYCEAEIVGSTCREGWLAVGQHLCIVCYKTDDCPTDNQTLQMWDLPINAPSASETDPKCSITVKYLHKKCKFVCGHPVLTILPDR